MRLITNVLRIVAGCLLFAGIAFAGQITKPNKNVSDVPNYDTLSTACLSLLVKNNGSAGNEGIGLVNMDWVANGDCDSTADVYLYSSSPVIGWIDGTGDTIMNWSAFGAWSGSPVGFVPLTAGSTESASLYTSYSSLFTTQDSSITLKQTWYAPTHVDSCDFIINELWVYNTDDADGLIPGVVIGEVVDWDVPSDSGLENGSGFDVGRNLIYQYGAEYHQDDTGASPACQDNDLRYAGIVFLQKMIRSATIDDAGDFYGTYTENNATYVYGNPDGLVMSEIYENMTNGDIAGGGFATWSSTDPESLYTDLHTGMSYESNYTVTPGETLVVYTAYATVQNGGLAGMEAAADAAIAWGCNNLSPSGCTCCENRGDVDRFHGGGGLKGPVDVSDLTYLVSFLFKGGPAPPCIEEANVDAIDGPAGPIDVNDLTYLVAFLFQGGPPPPPCW